MIHKLLEQWQQYINLKKINKINQDKQDIQEFITSFIVVGSFLVLLFQHSRQPYQAFLD